MAIRNSCFCNCRAFFLLQPGSIILTHDLILFSQQVHSFPGKDLAEGYKKKTEESSFSAGRSYRKEKALIFFAFFIYINISRRITLSKLMILADKINKYLRAKNLEKMSGTPEDLLSLYEMSLRSVWKIEDKEIREAYAVEIGHFLKPYFGGRNVAEALESLTDKLDKDFSEAKEHAEIQEIKDKMSEPGYVPTFDELMKSQDE